MSGENKSADIIYNKVIMWNTSENPIRQISGDKRLKKDKCATIWYYHKEDGTCKKEIGYRGFIYSELMDSHRLFGGYNIYYERRVNIENGFNLIKGEELFDNDID